MPFKFNPFTGKLDIVNSTSSSAPTGTPNRFAGYDALGALESINNWTRNTYGGADVAIAPTLTDPGVITSFQFNSDTFVTSPTNNLANSYIYYYLTQAQLGGTNDYLGITGHEFSITQTGVNDINGELSVLFPRITLGAGGVGSTSSNSLLVKGELRLSGNHVADDLFGFYSVVTMDGGTTSASATSFRGSTYVGGTSGTVYGLNQSVQIDGVATNVYGASINALLGDASASNTTDFASILNLDLNVNELHTINNGAEVLKIVANIETTSTVEYLMAMAINFTIDGTLNNNTTFINIAAGFNAAQTTGVTGVNYNPGFFNDINFVNGFAFVPTFNSGTDVSTSVNAFSDNAQIASGATFNTYTGINIAQNFDSGSTITGGYNGIGVSPVMAATMGASAGVNLLNLNGTFSRSMQFWNGAFVGSSINGTSVITNGIQPLTVTTNLNDTASASYYTGLGIFGTFDAGTSLGNYSAITVNPSLSGAITSSLYLANFTAQGAGTFSNVNGIAVDVSPITSTNQKNALSSNGGKFNASSPVNTGEFTVTVATQANFIGADFTIASGFPLAGEFVFGQLFNSNMFFYDNMPVDILGGLLGFSANAFVGQIASTLTKTTDNVNMLVAAGNTVTSPGDGGTITNLHLYRAIGVLPSGGNTTITNLYAFRADGLLSAASPTNLWGISIEDANAENYFQKSIAIGTATKKVSNADIALEVESLKAIRFARLTTAQRNALTAVDGMMIFNTSTATMEYYDGTNWIAF